MLGNETTFNFFIFALEKEEGKYEEKYQVFHNEIFLCENKKKKWKIGV